MSLSSQKAELTAATATITTRLTVSIIMSDEHYHSRCLSLLRLQTWLSPAFPTGSYSYSHGLEWAAEAGHIYDRKSLVDWLGTNLCYGSGRKKEIFFSVALCCPPDDESAGL